ncbi:hypothetical protein QJQ45_019820 [Haematococcus lacustris]|nr:hypothetical protein QJQ45_019820 [Haematococcus lacustris]
MHLSLKPHGAVGFRGKKQEDSEPAYDAKEEQWREANQRRSAVKQTVAQRKAERKQERDLLGQGIVPQTLKDWKPYNKKGDAEVNTGIIVPLLPFGNTEYDEGERFDLRSPYADEGWVDPEEVDPWAGFKNFSKKFLNFSGKEPESQVGKPILWASEYSKQQLSKEKGRSKK